MSIIFGFIGHIFVSAFLFRDAIPLVANAPGDPLNLLVCGLLAYVIALWFKIDKLEKILGV